MFIHNGEKPTLEIKCFQNKHSISLLFPGDMERQKFVERLIQQQEGEDFVDLINNGDGGRQSNMPMDSQDDFDDLYQDSEEEEINPIVYD